MYVAYAFYVNKALLNESSTRQLNVQIIAVNSTNPHDQQTPSQLQSGLDVLIRLLTR